VQRIRRHSVSVRQTPPSGRIRGHSSMPAGYALEAHSRSLPDLRSSPIALAPPESTRPDLPKLAGVHSHASASKHPRPVRLSGFAGEPPGSWKM